MGSPTPYPGAERALGRYLHADLLQALLALGALLLIGIGSYLWGLRTAAPAAPQPTTQATLAPSPAPTAAPTAAPAALIGYFDYSDLSSVAPITADQVTRVVGQAGGNWRLVLVGNARVWLPVDQVPTGVPQDRSLPDLTPRRPPPPAPAPVVHL
ncbi:MAG TPA: hypothetical protein VKE41_07560 [Roseiflexaceae bacterium]|nr:hypothetical protein [Roseiflexaceae bacterium]